MQAAISLRPRGADDLGLKRALSDRLLPLLVAAMTFLAVLACGGALAAGHLAAHWQRGAVSPVMVQVPRPQDTGPTGGSRAEAVAHALATIPGSGARRLGPAEIATLMRPWLGDDAVRLSPLLPGVFELAGSSAPAGLQDRLAQLAPGTLVQASLPWLDRLGALARSLQAIAALTVLLVTVFVACVIAMAARAGLAALRDTIDIVHGLGGTDGMIAGRFAARVALLTFGGALLGAMLALPVLLGLAKLAAPFAPRSVDEAATPLETLPLPLWAVLACLPLFACAIGWATTQATVRSWLARLP